MHLELTRVLVYVPACTYVPLSFLGNGIAAMESGPRSGLYPPGFGRGTRPDWVCIRRREASRLHAGTRLHRPSLHCLRTRCCMQPPPRADVVKGGKLSYMALALQRLPGELASAQGRLGPPPVAS